MNFPDSKPFCTFGHSRVYFGKSEAGGVAMAIGFLASNPNQALPKLRLLIGVWAVFLSSNIFLTNLRSGNLWTIDVLVGNRLFPMGNVSKRL